MSTTYLCFTLIILSIQYFHLGMRIARRTSVIPSKPQKKEVIWLPLRGNRQRPILPGRVQPSTFGTGELNYCVRYGNRWDLSVITTGRVSGLLFATLTTAQVRFNMRPLQLISLFLWMISHSGLLYQALESSPRPISINNLHALPHFQRWPITW